MNRLHLPRVDQVALTALATAASFFTLLSWQGLAEHSSAYLVPLFLVCVVTGVVGLALRTLGAPTPVVPLVQLVVAFLVFNGIWAAEQSLEGVVPTRDSVAQIVSVLVEGSRQATLWPAPVPPAGNDFPALMLGIGILVVLLVDVLACTLRKVPVAGLPLLAAFTVPVSIVGGVSWVTFAVAALCFTLLLTADQAARLGRWGHTLSPRSRQHRGVVDNQPHRVRLGTLWPSATRYAVAGVAIAVVAPALLPQSLELFGGDGPGDGFEQGDSVTLRNPIVSIQRRLNQGEDVPLVTVRTDDPDPAYLRLSVLDEFDGTTWRPSQRDIPPSQTARGAMPAPPGLSASTPRKEYSSEISVDPAFDTTWLPTPYPLTQIRVSGDWRYDVDTLDLLSTEEDLTAAGLQYAASALVVDPAPATMVNAPVAPRSIYAAYTDLPSTVPPWITDLAKSITAEGKSQFEKAVILQRWFLQDGGFTYSTATGSGSSLEQLELFLGTGEGSRIGYCEQFATAMAMMTRALGIPTRVAVGFLRPERQPDGSYVYSARDMHAWPELYFEGAGWTTFDPTPADSSRPPSYTQGRVPKPGNEPTIDPSVSDFNEEIKPSAAVEAGQAPAAPGTAGSPSTTYAGVGVLLLVLLLLLLPRFVRGRLRRSRLGVGRDPAHRLPVDVAEGAWAEVRATALDLRLGWDDGATLRRRARSLAASLDGDRRLQPARAALESLVLLMERSRYSRRGLPADQAIEVLAATGEVLASLRSRALPSARRRATWLPSSLWQSRKVHGSPRRPSDADAGSKVPTDELEQLSV